MSQGPPEVSRRPRRRTTRVAAVVAVVLAVGVGVYLAMRRGAFDSNSGAPTNVLVISLDTIRADHLGAYGNKKIETPNLDALAARGALFERCMTAVPLTLPSHTSIFTGTYPAFNGVRDNGDFVVPKELTTMAQLFHARGYRTGAFVGAFVLDSRWGLAKGFDEYSDHFDMHPKDMLSIGDIRRPANEVADDALAWLAKIGAKDHAFFAWVHMYDPHSPYDPPAAFGDRYPGDAYSAEVAFSDEQIGRILKYLDESGLRKTTLVVFAGDHGESLGEHKEFGHGYFVYQPSLRVPLIFAGPGAGRPGSRRTEMISLVDIFPTVLALSGVPGPPGVQGRSLVPLLRNESGWVERPVYSETYFPRLHYGWSELRSIQERRYKFIDSSEPELFDIEHDAAESQNLLEKRPDLLPAMRQRLEVLVAGLEKGAKSATQQSDPETVAKLASLGYLSASPGAIEGDAKNLPSPRRKLVIHNNLMAAREEAGDGDLKLAEASLRKALKEDPRIIDAYSALGNLCLKEKRAKEAVEFFLQAVQLRPGDPLLIVGLASSLIRDGKPDEAESILRKAMVTMPEDARMFFLLGSIEENRNEPAKALPLFEKTLALNPKSAPAESEVAGMYWRLKDPVKAREHAQKAIALDPGIEGAHLTLGRILESQGENDKAMAEYAEETRLGSENFRAQYEFANMNLKLGHRAEAEDALQKTIELNPAFPPAYLYLAKSYLDDGNRYPKAIELTEKALKLTLTPKDKAFAYFLLADLYNRTGDVARSKQFAQRGAALGS